MFLIFVSIPFKREIISKVGQTGLEWQFKLLFQFPSNGKSYPKCGRQSRRTNRLEVSIPFKREIISKGCTLGTVKRNQPSFNSLQTGNHIQSGTNHARLFQHPKCFNSLQTGNHIQSLSGWVIPTLGALLFQFPSNGKAYPKEYDGWTRRGVLMFQFPSNGKAYPKGQEGCFRVQYATSSVSIPFKRESISKVISHMWQKII